MAEDIDFEIGHFLNFDGPVTLTLTSDELEIYIVENDLSACSNTIFACGYIEFYCGRSFVRSYVRTDGQTFFY